MAFKGSPFDPTYYEQRDNPTDPQRGDGYTSYEEINPAHWVAIADDIEAQTGLVSGKDVLEAGCAYGFLANELASRGANVEGFDISSYAIGEAQARFPALTFTEADLAAGIGGPPNRYDLFVAVGITDCMPDNPTLFALLNEFDRLLKPNGDGYILGSETSDDDYLIKSPAEWGLLAVPGRILTPAFVGDVLPWDIRVVIS
jgi:2-polyprenyl-3-methyl-5-hydroxy-6-metoxy-1,4-benzoquinol methylase